MKKILIVDDQIEVRELVELTLRGEGYQTFLAKSGEEAISIAKAEKPDLIVMDVMMPGEIDGLEAMRIIKNDQKLRNCKIIMLTAKGQTFDVEAGIKAGANSYFIKPFSPLELMKKIEEAVGE
jgi:CheY-like chemotaxis protein